ncbi:MAG: hypothetical protein FWE08_07100 [Oscillospiraceae bacterium]|nr:hypothetical protein [Oscillospiraceae bacterium]
MENAVKYNMGKGILFALIGMVVGFGLWLAVIALFGVGTGGAVGGALAAVLGMAVAAGYKLGQGKPGVVGIVIVALLTAIAAAGVIIFGSAIILYQEGFGSSVWEALDLLFGLMEISADVSRVFFQDLAISVGIATVLAIVAMVGGNKKKA